MTPAPDYTPDLTLSAQQHRVIALLVQGQSITETAAAENLHRNTISNWRRTVPAFAAELDFALSEQHELWQGRATLLMPHAIEVLEATLTDPKASPSLRFRAATTIIKLATAPEPKPRKSAPRQALPLQMHNCAQAENYAELHNHAQSNAGGPEKEFFDIEEAAHNSMLPQQQPKPQPIRVSPIPGRNEQCHCGSTLKYKHCCLNRAAA